GFLVIGVGDATEEVARLHRHGENVLRVLAGHDPGRFGERVADMAGRLARLERPACDALIDVPCLVGGQCGDDSGARASVTVGDHGGQLIGRPVPLGAPSLLIRGGLVVDLDDVENVPATSTVARLDRNHGCLTPGRVVFGGVDTATAQLPYLNGS